MAAVSSAIGLQSVTQTTFQQLKLQQAMQNADRAEQVARNLQVDAVEAQREADRAQENARNLSVRSSQAQVAAGRARQGVSMINEVGDLQEGLTTILNGVIGSLGRDAGSSSTAPAQAAPVINTSGQVTGTVINTVA